MPIFKRLFKTSVQIRENQGKVTVKPKERETRRRIIDATIEVIEQRGIASLTVRAIARKAGVNIAAINYYFGSKEQLLDSALLLTLDNAFADPLREFPSHGHTREELLSFVLADWLQGMANYPGISRAHVIGHHLKRKQRSRSIERLGTFLEELAARLNVLDPGGNSDDIRISLVQMVSAIILPAILPEIFASFLNADLTRPPDRERYLNRLLLAYSKEAS